MGRAGLAGSLPCDGEIEKMFGGSTNDFGALGLDGERKTGQDVRTQNGDSLRYIYMARFLPLTKLSGKQIKFVKLAVACFSDGLYLHCQHR